MRGKRRETSKGNALWIFFAEGVGFIGLIWTGSL